MPRQVEDRVADELAWPVVGRLAAAVGLDDLDLGAVGNVQLARVRSAPERDHGRVLEQDHRVGDRPVRDRGRERALQLPRLAVRRRPEAQQVSAATHPLTLAANFSDRPRTVTRTCPLSRTEPEGQAAEGLLACP